MAFFGLLITIAALFASFVLYYMLHIAAVESSLQRQVSLYSNIVSAESFAQLISLSFPHTSNATLLSNWRSAVYESAVADQANVSVIGNAIVVRSTDAPYAYAVIGSAEEAGVLAK